MMTSDWVISPASNGGWDVFNGQRWMCWRLNYGWAEDYIRQWKGNEMMHTFDDLVFLPHKSGLEGHTHAKMTFDNGFRVSVICGKEFYSNGKDTYEVMTLNGDVSLPLADNVRHGDGTGVYGHLSAHDVTAIMVVLQNYGQKPRLSVRLRLAADENENLRDLLVEAADMIEERE